MKKEYDYLIVGAGFFGSICAYELNKKGYSVCVVESRGHIGGNCYTFQDNGINIHKYGPHVFHTSNRKIWDWVNQFAEFNNFTLNPVANYKGELYSLPFNMWTFNKLWGVTNPDDARAIIEHQSSEVKGDPRNLEEQAIKLVGRDVYEKLIKGYTEKQWRKESNKLPKEIIKRIPVRFTFDGNYFNDIYQGVPVGGYTQIFEKLLDGIDVRLNFDYFQETPPAHKKLIYTGPIDRFYNYRFGHLEYKTTRFDHVFLDKTSNFQGVAMVNYTDIEIPYTRIIEHKHFEKKDSNGTWITYEYPQEYISGISEPYYPVNDDENDLKYAEYKKLAKKEKNVYFGGRLAEYKYYDMHQVIKSAMLFCERI